MQYSDELVEKIVAYTKERKINAYFNTDIETLEKRIMLEKNGMTTMLHFSPLDFMLMREFNRYAMESVAKGCELLLQCLETQEKHTS